MSVAKVKRYFYNQLLVADIWLNVQFGGSPYETCSSRLGRHEDTSKIAHAVAMCIDWVAYKLSGLKNHCKSNVLAPEYFKNLEVLS